VQTLKKKLRLAKEAGIPLMLWGKPGLGKSQGVYQFGDEISWRVITLILAQVEATDLIGMPKAIPILEAAAREKFREVLLAVNGSMTADSVPSLLAAYADNYVTAYAMPQWMVGLGDEPCIIFLDEANRGRRFEINAVHQLVLEKRLFTHQFHPDTMIVSACNPMDEEEFGLTTFGQAFFSRFSHVKVEASKEAWVTWAKGHGIHSAVIGHVEKGGKNSLDPTTFDFENLVLARVKPNGRAWEFVSNVVRAAKRLGITHYGDALWTIVEGLIGTSEKQTFQEFFEKDWDPLDAKDILYRVPGAPDHSVERLLPDVRQRIVEWSDMGNAKLPALMESFERALKEATKLIQSNGLNYYVRDTPACNFCGTVHPSDGVDASELYTLADKPCVNPSCAENGGRVVVMSKRAWDDFGSFFQALLLAPGSVQHVIMDKMDDAFSDIIDLFPVSLYWAPMVEPLGEQAKIEREAGLAEATGVNVDDLQDGK